MLKVGNPYEEYLNDIEEKYEEILGKLKNTPNINYNYYNCSFNYGDHGYARNESHKENN